MIRPMKPPRDVNQRAKLIVDLATGQAPVSAVVTESKQAGGMKGGKRRAAVLTPAQRAEIARTAATARWKKTGGEN